MSKSQKSAVHRAELPQQNVLQMNEMTNLNVKQASSNLKKNDRQRRLEKAREEGLKETFPASDPVAVIEPAPTLPGDDSDTTDHEPRGG